jgi:hypothetical protein
MPFLDSDEMDYMADRAIRAGNLNQLISAVVEHGFETTIPIYLSQETRSRFLQRFTTLSLRRARHWAQRARRLRGRR